MARKAESLGKNSLSEEMKRRKALSEAFARIRRDAAHEPARYIATYSAGRGGE